ncbi:MAG: SDR family NAD(P)-dependent oxidoreductase [Chloroflexi bacterium]|nr:SDR family NAD(P)-dependent oxidoreductase [Chloroflexota bacterium]
MSLPSFSVDGKVTVVTGASGDIGRALALGFAAAGSPVVLVSRRPGPLQTLANQIKTAGGRALCGRADQLCRRRVI